MYNTKNYTEQGGEKTVIGGEIVIEGKITVADGGRVEGITGVTGAATESTLGGIKAAARGAGDTVEVKIGENGKLYAPTYPTDATESVSGLVKKAANQADSIAENTATLVTDFNALLAKLKAAGLMAANEE